MNFSTHGTGTTVVRVVVGAPIEFGVNGNIDTGEVTLKFDRGSPD